MPETTPQQVLRDLAGTLGEPFATNAARRIDELPAVVAEKLVAWQPQLSTREVSRAQWAQWEALVRVAAACTRPAGETVAASIAGTALSLVQYAVVTRRMPLRPAYIFRASTAEVYLATLTVGTQHVVGSHLRALVEAVTAATTEDPTASRSPAAATGLGADELRPGPDTATGGGSEVAQLEVEPLLLDEARPTTAALQQLQLDTTAGREVLEVLAAVRDRVLEVEPTALRREPRLAGRARNVPFGDVEVIGLLSNAATLRVTKSRHYATCLICLGIGAGISGEVASGLTGADVIAHHPALDGPAVRTPHRIVPLHTTFAGPVLRSAELAGPTGWLLGGSRARTTRVSQLVRALAKADPHMVRLSAARLQSTWLAMQLTRGVPVRDVLATQGYTSAAPIDAVLAYLPARTRRGDALLGGHDAGPVTRESVSDVGADLTDPLTGDISGAAGDAEAAAS